MRHGHRARSRHHYLDWMFLSENWFLFPLAVVALGAGIWFRRRATLDRRRDHRRHRARVLRTGRACATIFGKAPGVEPPAPAVLVSSCCTCSRRSAPRSWCACSPLGITWVVRGDRRARRSYVAADVTRGRAVRADDARRRRGAGRRRCRRASPPPPASVTPRPAPRRPPRRDGRGRRHRHDGLPRDRAERARLHPVLGQVQLHRLRERHDRRLHRRSRGPSTARSSTPRTRSPPGRMLWEGGDAIGAYGTPLALMLLPYWTHGRIQSMEGLYFEASTTTPYHFMTVATLAPDPSNPVRGLPYKNIADFDLGVQYLQLMGVRYYAAFSTDGQGQGRRRTRTLDAGRDRARPRRQAAVGMDDLPRSPTRPTVQAAARTSRSWPPACSRSPAWKCEGEPEPRGHRRPGRRVQPVGVQRGAVVRRSRPRSTVRSPTTGPPSLDSAPAARSALARRRSRRCPTSTVSNIRTTESSVEFDVSRTACR